MYDKIIELRKQAGLSQVQVGEIIGISQRGYSHYERGSRDIPTQTLITLADYYDVSIDYMLGRTDCPKMKKS